MRVLALSKRHEEETKVPLGSRDQVQDIPHSSVLEIHMEESEEMVITSIRAEDIALGIGRIPAGFYTAVQHSGCKWRTVNVPVAVDNGVVNWDGPIPIPSDISATIHIEIYASFEFQPMLGDGERLRDLEVTVGQLFDRSEDDLPFTFFPEDGDDTSPCSSVLIKVKRRQRESDDSSKLRALDPYCSIAEPPSELQNMTNEGHSALLRYRKHGEIRDLEYSIEQFERALDICSLDHPCRAAAESNLAMAKFIRCQIDDSDSSLDVPLALYRNALAARPVGHHDRPSTLIQLAAVYYARFDRRRDEVDVTEAEALLHQAVDLSTAESHEKRAAVSILELRTGRGRGPVQAGNQSSVGRDSASEPTHEDPSTLGTQLLDRFQRFHELDDLHRAILYLKASVRSTSGHRHCLGLANLGTALLKRFDRLGEPSDLEEGISKFQAAFQLIPDGSPGKLICLRNLGQAFLTRFESHGELHDLEKAVTSLRDAADLCPDGHLNKPVFLIGLAKAFLTRFNHFAELNDLDQAIARSRDAVDLTPDGHPGKAGILNDHGNTLLKRFERVGELRNLDQAISRFRNAVDLRADGQPDKPAFLHNLGVALRARFRKSGELNDLEQAISSLEHAVNLTPDGDTDKPTQLHDLSMTIKDRFQRLGKLSDLERAVSGCREAVDLAPESHPDKPVYLNDLANIFLARFDCLGDLSDLDQAESRQMNAINLIPDSHPRKYAFLNNLYNVFITRFERLGELGDLEQAISSQRRAVELIPDDDPDKPALLDNLGTSFHTRFRRLGELSDIEQAIVRLRDAIDLVPDDDRNKPSFLNHLAGAFFSRFEFLGETSALEHAISRYKDSLDITPDGHPDKPRRLSYLSEVFRARFEHLGKVQDLENAILMGSDAVSLISNGQPDKATLLSNLGNALRFRFEHLGALSDLEQAISMQIDAVSLTPDGDNYKPLYQNNLGSAFGARFGRLGEVSDLEQAITMCTNAVESTPNYHPDKPHRLGNLGNTFLRRFWLLGELSDLEEAIAKYRNAVDLTPHHHVYQPLYMNNLGNTYITRFKRFGDLGDLGRAISISSDAVSLLPDGHASKPAVLDTLGNAFSSRFQRLREITDIEQAISTHEQAVELISDGHPSKPLFLNNLSVCFLARFECLRDMSDLEKAISRSGDAVGLIPDGKPYEPKPILLTNFGNAILARFKQLGRLIDLEEAISRYQEAVDLAPKGHPYKLSSLNNLGRAFKTRFQHLNELSDLDQAISAYERVIHLTPVGHPDRPDRLSNLGTALVLQSERLEEKRSLERAISLFSQAACASAGSTTSRFNASLGWISLARTTKHPTLLHAYSVAVGFLPQLAWIGYTIADRYQELLQSTDMVREAAAAALDCANPQTAVEWLEQGRSIVWGELFQLRSSYEELSSVYPDHALRLQQLSTELEHASVAEEKSLSLLRLSDQSQSTTESYATKSLQQEADRHRTLAIQRDGLLQEIRGLPGFERFLLHKEFSRLRASAHSGPVVILNAAETRCDALIIRDDVDHVIHVPLRDFTFKQFAGLQNTLKSLLRARVQRYGERDAQLAPLEGIDWESFLSPLWRCVVKPVLDALGFSTPATGNLPRIFWCPTGPFVFLPIHAAGFYDPRYSQPGHKVFDFVISSYIPTLSILGLEPSPSPDVSQNNNLRFLAVRQPRSDGLPQLPGVETELRYIKEVIEKSPLTLRTTLLESSLGTVEETLSLMKEADWVHFACHGIQDPRRPTDSGLCLADGRRLKLTDIIALSRPQGGLAFLSACQTATGYVGLSDEAIHLAAGMLFAGYRSVVGTMWLISDRLAPDVARDVYEQLFQNDTRPNDRDAARALQEAVGYLRDGGASFDEWLPFIHVGL